jgi:hypothetical protein
MTVRGQGQNAFELRIISKIIWLTVVRVNGGLALLRYGYQRVENSKCNAESSILPVV